MMLKQLPRYSSYREVLEWMLKRPAWVLAAVLTVTIVFAFAIPNLHFSTSVYDLIIEDLPENDVYKQFKSVFGSDEIVRVVVKAGDVLDPLTFEKISAIALRAAEIEGVKRVISIAGVKQAVDPSGNWDLEKFATVLEPVAMFENNLVAKDRKSTALTLVLETGFDSQEVIRHIDSLIADADKGLSLYQIGMPLVSRALEQYTQRDFFRLPPITFLLIGIVLLLLFRRFVYILLPLLSVFLVLVWTFGLMAMTRIPLSMLTMIVPVFLIAVGTAYCLHILAEYQMAWQDSRNARQAVITAFSSIYFPTVLAVTTTVIGLGSLLLNHIPAIREFALFSCFGMFSLLLIVLTFFPVLLSLWLPPPKVPSGDRREGRMLDRLLDFIIDVNLNRQKMVFTIFGAVVVICLAGMFQLRVETNPIGYFRNDTDIRRNFRDIYKHLSGSFPINVTVTGIGEDYFQDPKQMAAIQRLQQFLETLPGVDKTISFFDYLKLVKYASNQFEPQQYALPEKPYEVRMLTNTYKSMLGNDMLVRFMNPEFSTANIVLLTHISSSRDFLAIRDRIREHVADHFSKDLKWEITGFGMVVSSSSHLLTSGQIKSLSLTMLVVFGIMFLLFLSSKVGLVAIVPNLFPIVINFGIMGWLGIELSMFTSLIASIAIGLAVDDTIHYLVRYNHEFRKDLDERRALRETIRRIGRPIIYTTLTISIGFSVLGFSSFKPTAVFGAMMVITLLSAMVADLVLLPSLMLHVELVTLWDLVRLKIGMEPRKGIPVFQGLSRTQVHYIIMSGGLTQIDKGTVLFRRGEVSDSMYVLLSGRLDVFDTPQHEDPLSGSRKRLASLQAGELLGEMGLLRSAPRSATVVATEPCELLTINLGMIKRLQWLYPPTANKFFFNLMNILCNRLERISHIVSDEGERDDYTGLYNARSFLQILEKEANRSVRYNSELSLCLLEIDIESRLGGDSGTREALVEAVCRTLARETRKCDTTGRFHSLRYGVLMPESSLREAQPVCERLKQVVLSSGNENGHGRFSVRFGLVAREEVSESGAHLLSRAETELEALGTPKPDRQAE